MKTSFSLLGIVIYLSAITTLFAQDQKETGVFVDEKDGYYKNEILKSIDEFNNPEKAKKKIFQISILSLNEPGMRITKYLLLYTLVKEIN